jgi:adenylate cyclase
LIDPVAGVATGLSADSLAALARSTREQVESLTELGLLDPDPDGYVSGDVHRIRLVEAFAAAGVPTEALARANAQGTISLAYYDQLHQTPGRPSTRTYGDMLAGLGDRAGDLRAIFQACGIAEPEVEDRLGQGEERLLLAVLEAVAANRDRDLSARALRVFGDTARRGSEAAMSVYAEAVERATPDVAGIPPTEVFHRFLEPWARFARLVPELTAWLHARHLSAAIDTWSVEETERLLAESGFVPERQVEPPAIAFVDLSGFTRLSELAGDREAARVAMAFTILAGRIAERRGGRLVKQLGDGVLLRFPSARSAVEATLDTLDGLEPEGLPLGHAGVHAGPVIVREGDVFGRTVNLAARIADRAQPGQLLTSMELAASLPIQGLRYEPVGPASLQGITEPVPLARISRAAASG